MSPVTHFLAGWMVASATELNRRERALVAIAGIAPDADGLGIVAEFFTRGTQHELNWWSDYHHVLGHNLTFALFITALTVPFAQHRWKVAALVCLSFHLHLFCDLVGARGPDGHIWDIPYLWPGSKALTLAWSGQWKLNAWPNFVLTAGLIAMTLRLAWRRGYSPLEMVSSRADAAVVATLRRRFPAGERK